MFMLWKVMFYQTERGESPIAEFLESLPEKAQVKCIDYMLLLEERGNRLPSNYASKVEDNLWELRPEFSGIEYRYFYFSYVDNQIVIVHAVSKKSQRLKPGDVKLSLSRVEEVRRREAARQKEIEKAKNDNADPGSIHITPAIRHRPDRG
jgi:phage-related protein